MARIRSVHPELFTDEAFNSVSIPARLLAIGIWTQCDDHGVFEWKPFTLRITIFPGEKIEVEQLLAELEAAHIVKPFEHGGKGYGAVRNFCRFQKPKKPNYKHPLPREWVNYTGFNLREEATASPPVENQSPPRTPRRGEERREGNRENSKTKTIKTERESPPTPSAAPTPAAPDSPPDLKRASQEGQSSPLKALGTQLPADWTPDDALCEDLKRDFGMTEEDIRSELLAFHAHHAAAGSFSANWRATFTTWGKRWKDHKAKQAPPRIELQRMPGSGDRYVPTEADWDTQVKRWLKNNSHWSRQFGPEPGMSGCKCPPEILERHGIDPKTGLRRSEPKVVSA